MKNHTLHGKSASAKSGWLIVILWGLGLIGICGVHRLYMGRRLSGVLQLISLGGLGVWQMADAVWLLLGRMRDGRGARIRLWQIFSKKTHR